MSELPEGWQTSTVGECFLEIKNGTTATQNTLASGIPVSRIETIQNHKFDLNRIKHIESPPDELVEAYRYQKGDIAFSHINSFVHVGKTALYEGKPETLIHGMNLLRLRRGHEFIHPKFAHYFMLSDFFREEVRKRVGHAVNQVSINQKSLSEVPFVLAPLNEQHRIVAKLQNLLSRVDVAQARLAAIPRILKRFRQSVLVVACSGRLTADWRPTCNGIEYAAQLIRRLVEECNSHVSTKPAKGKARARVSIDESIPGSNKTFEIPESWAWASLDDIRQEHRPIIYGIIKPGPHVPDGVAYVRVTEMKEGVIDVSSLKRTSHERAAKFRRATLKAGDILISKDGTIGRVAVVPPELEGGNITQHVIRFPVHPLMNRDYIALAIRSPDAQKWMTGETRGVALQGVNVEDFRRLPIPIPPLVEQQEIVRRVEALFKTADELEARYRKAKAHVDRLTQSILAKAFRGELVPQDPHDEPASVLLKRIRMERNGRESKKRSRRK